MKTIVGLISDTHGLIRPEATRALAGSELIIHAGDVGSPRVLDELGLVATVRAVRGNVDHDSWSRRLPQTASIQIAGHSIYVLHDLSMLHVDPAAAAISVVVSGHTHTPRIERRGRVLFVNPGSAGPRRFALPVSVARLELEPGQAHAELITLLQPQ